VRRLPACHQPRLPKPWPQHLDHRSRQVTARGAVPRDQQRLA
jgi:hypothetical protein